MAGRRGASPVELASRIGEVAFDLHCYGDLQARAALAVVAQVNPEMLAWLRDRLHDITRQPLVPGPTTVVGAAADQGEGERCADVPSTGEGGA